ncbi:MAG: response regulator [Candidatus Roizmanbacteria bacterium]|nr:response regulator [Candidatus Roizmanbacteria bacterium]
MIPQVPKKIMVIDDDYMILTTLNIVLTDYGYTVVVSIDNRRALRHIRKHLPDLLILDVMMPGKNGMEILSEVKKDRELRSIPIMLISSAANLSHIAQLHHADAFLEKPFSLEKLESMVERILPH